MLGRGIADVLGELPAGVGSVGSAHIAIPVSLAITDAAAIAALLASPPITARCSCPTPATENPSLRQTDPSQQTRESASRSAARFVTCRPRASIPGAHREITATLAAIRRITG